MVGFLVEKLSEGKFACRLNCVSFLKPNADAEFFVVKNAQQIRVLISKHTYNLILGLSKRSRKKSSPLSVARPLKKKKKFAASLTLFRNLLRMTEGTKVEKA